ncbi:FUSC family protein [Streptomyces catenulae]|uniref:FUSC family protein n=1 Tax=Streptomyces catenulae TaxID=66875 RepID=A0ABV2Z8P7_9ACTN|nr:FUSC family protein [Streptomyces catenulae]
MTRAGDDGRTPAARGPRQAVAGVVRVLSPRGSLTLHPVDGAFTFALRAALAMALPALVLAATGRTEQAVYAMLGAFTTTFGRNLPYRRRAGALALVALAMTACVGVGSALAAWALPRPGGAAVVVAATALVAGAAKYACDAARLGGLGAVLLLFAFAAAANGTAGPADVLPHTALAAAGAALAWALAMAGRLVHPDRPQRLAVAAALRALAALWDAPGADHDGRRRHRATAAVLRAHHALGLLPRAAGGERHGGVCVRLTELSWSLLIGSATRPPDDPAALARQLREQARALADRRRRVPPLLPGPASWTVGDRTGRDAGAPPTAPPSGAGLRAAELLAGRHPGGPGHRSVLLVPALRMALGTALAGGAAPALGLGHGYWAAVSAAAVLHSINVRTATQRAVQRTLGTAAGLVLALAILALAPGPGVLVAVIVVLEFLLEYVVPRNYGLGVVFLTPLALLMTDLTAPEAAGTLVADRALASVLGIVVGLLCGLLVVHDRAVVRAERALTACAAATAQAERALDGGATAAFGDAQARLAVAVVELREADDAAAGEVWRAEIDPAELAAAEARAHLLLERFARG